MYNNIWIMDLINPFTNPAQFERFTSFGSKCICNIYIATY